jgi:RHS repeat-associated protein
MSTGPVTVGHPVDVASGAVYSNQKDIFIRGKFPLTWERNYHSGLLSRSGSPLGPGWTCRYFASLTRIRKDYHFRTPEGALEIFPDPGDEVERGKPVGIPESALEISKSGLRLAVTRWNHETGETIRYLFQPGRNGEFWPLRAMENPVGHGLELAWDESGRLKGIRQKLERRTLTFSHNAQGRIAAISVLHQDGHSRILACYEYDALGRLSAVFDANGSADRYEYDGENRMVRELIKDGGVFDFKYDDKGRCIRTSGQDAYDLKVLRYLDHVNMTEVTDSRGHVSRYKWLPSGQVVLSMDPTGAITETEYDGLGRPAKVTKPNGAINSYAYDEAGHRWETVNPLGKTMRRKYNATHLPYEVEDYCGQVWSRKYDSRNRIVEMSNPLGGKWEYAYDDRSLLTRITDPRGFSKVFTYDSSANLVSATDWDGNAYKYRHDELGRIVEIADPLGNATRYRYDGLGRVVHTSFADGSFKALDYDSGGNIRRIETHGSRRTFRYGPCRRLLEETDSNGNVSRFSWGTEPKHLERIINAKGEVSEFRYDPAGRLVSEKGFDGRKRSFQYDPAGHCIAMINGNGERIVFGRDLEGRTISTLLPDGETSEFGYDPAGRLVRAANPTCEVLLERDAVGRIVREAQGEGSVSSALNGTGHRVSIALGSGEALALELDGNGYVTRLGAGGGQTMDLERNALGMDIRRSLPAGFALEKTYDAKCRPISVRTAQGVGQPFRNRQYAYSAAGLLQARMEAGVKTAFEYDPGGRLLQEKRTGAEVRTYGYDALGNWIRHAVGDREGESAEISRGSRMIRKGRFRFEYDSDGRLIRKTEQGPSGEGKSWAYAWDAKGQLKSVLNPAGETWRYAYDALGRRVSKVGTQGVTRYQWDGNTVIRQWNETRSEIWLHEPSSFRPLAKLEGGRILPIVTDPLGSPLELLDSDGSPISSNEYSGWGEVATGGDGPSECPIRFPGQWFDEESGLHYNRFRYYDPAAGRYISQDPIGIAGGLNPYAYAPNPLSYADPFGLCPLGDLSEEEVRQIQQVVDDAGRPLEVVGSAARGERRNPGTDLPFGKGEGTRSDIDYAIPPSSIEYFNAVDATHRLPDVDPHHGLPPSIHSPHDGPSIRFSPGEDPQFIPGAT